ncbi:MAG: prolipoprotein diacylglyceryl transferase [Planctomycetota bacterium]
MTVLDAMTLAQAVVESGDLGGFMPKIDPFILQFTESFGLRWYSASYLVGAIIAYFVLRALAKRGLTTIPVERAFDVIVTVFFGVLLGGRLGYILFYRPSLLWTFDDAFPFWGVLRLQDGGMASHGGMIGVVVAAWLVARGFQPYGGDGKPLPGPRIGKSPPLHVMDMLCLLAPFGIFFGRVANFINGELLGKIVAVPGERAPWWAVRYPTEHLSETHAPALTIGQELELNRLLIDTAPTATTFEEAYPRMLERVWAGDAEVISRLEPLLSARHPSQLYQAVAEGLIVGAVVWAVFRRPRKPGVVLGWFLMSYGALRIVTEFFRLPDGHFTGQSVFDLASARPLGLSRGQWLSALMVVIGAAVVVVVLRRKGEKLGGWGRGVSQPSKSTAS